MTAGIIPDKLGRQFATCPATATVSGGRSIDQAPPNLSARAARASSGRHKPAASPIVRDDLLITADDT
jgi:hypothetical protein